MLNYDRLTVKAGEASACRGTRHRVGHVGDALQVQFEHTQEGVEEGLLQPA